MTDNLDFYDCNSSSNSFLKFDLSSIEVDIAEEISTSPATVEVINFEGQMNTMSNNNPLLSTASIPLSIPRKSDFSGISNISSNNQRILADLSDIVFEFDKSQSPMNDSGDNSGFRPNQIIISNDGNLFGMQNNSFGNNLTWEINSIMNSTNMMVTDPGFQMDEDDIFQVDKSDLIQGPTLAELNGDNLYKDLLNMEEMLTSESAQILPSQTNQNQFTQLTTANFHNLQNAIESNMNSIEIPQSMFQTINVPQTPHNTPSCPSYLSGGNIIFYEDQPSNSPYEVYSPPNTVPTSSLTINTLRMANSNQQSAGQMSAFSPGSHSSTSTSSVLLNSSLSPPQPNQFSPQQSSLPLQSPRSHRSSGMVQHNPKFTTLHELLLKKEHIAMSPSPPSQLLNNNNNNNASSLSPVGLSGVHKRLHMSGGSISRLSSSAPSHSGLESIWQRREPRQHLLSTGSLAEAGSTSSLSGVLSPEAPDLSQDEAYSDDDSDHYEDFSSGMLLY
jgi:hypothetical protein